MAPSDEISRKRLPGIMVFDHRNELLYASEGARGFLEESASLRNEVSRLLESLGARGEKTPAKALSDRNLTLKAVPLYRTERKESAPSHTMVIIDRAGGASDASGLMSRFSLTKREAQVAVEISKGLTNQEISQVLSISEHTVKDHIKKIMDKLGARSRSMIISRMFN